VAIFGPTDPVRNGPYQTSDAAQSIVLRNPASETTHARRAQPDVGLMEIGVDSVVDAARILLATGNSGGQECPRHTEGAHG
jgi:heptosyltransferase I